MKYLGNKQPSQFTFGIERGNSDEKRLSNVESYSVDFCIDSVNFNFDCSKSDNSERTGKGSHS